MAIRLKDIARELDVSVITVSKALRGNTDISEATRARILALVKELDYQPNMAARSLATGRSFIVGLIVPDLLNPFFTELANSVATILRTHAYGLILSSSGGDPAVEQTEIRMMQARGVDALLLASCQPHLNDFVSTLRDLSFVLVDRPFPRMRANFVGTDDHAGGRLATQHLIQLGRTRLAYIGSPELGPAAERFRGFRSALEDHRVKLRDRFILPLPVTQSSTDDAGYTLMQSLLRHRRPPDGVFCHNDVIAIGAMRATLDAGLTIPGDIAFVGFDNVHYAKYLQIPLTSVDQSTVKLGKAVAELALDLVAHRLAKAACKPRTILLAPTLVVRQSTCG